MDVAALVTWLITAVGGFVLLGTWIAKGGQRRDGGAGSGAGSGSRFSPGMIFGHFLLAAVGLVLWIVYVASDSRGLAWVAFAIIAVVAALGFTMFFRWLPQVRDRSVRSGTATAEAQFPVAVVVAHGVLAATTLVLVLIAAAVS